MNKTKKTMMRYNAYMIAKKAHEGQVDKGGRDYFDHPLRIAKNFEDDIHICVALLHDVIEDSGFKLKDLIKAGMTYEITDAVRILTKDKNEPYDEYLKRVSKNKISTAVKLADLKDNMDMTRLKELTDKDITRLKKYHRAYMFLSGIKPNSANNK